jgi:hypothetical protein
MTDEEAKKFSHAQPLYAERKIITFPVKSNKVPAVKNWPHIGLKGSAKLATSKLGESPGIAVRTDRVVTIIDVDSADESVFADALNRHGHTPLITRTASGKWHAWYKHNGERRHIRPWRGVPVDLLGKGGYAVAPPSRLDVGEYSFIAGSLDDIPNLPIARNVDLPDAAPDLQPRHRDGPITEGQRNSALWRHCMRQAQSVDNFDALLDVARTFNEFQCQPPLGDDEVIAAAHSAWEYTLKGQNWFGRHGAWLPKEEVNGLATESDALFLLLFLRANQGPNALFICANALADKFGWRRHRFAEARRRLTELGKIEPVRQAGYGRATLFRWPDSADNQ